MGENGSFTAKQEAFIAWYVKLKNGTEAAKRAGYSGDRVTLEAMARETLGNPRVKAEIQRRFKERLPSAEEVLDLITTRAKMDISPYLKDDMTLDVRKLADAGLGHLIVGVKPGRNGTEITLVSPQKATQNLARYHKILGSDVSVDLTAQIDLDETAIASLAGQIATIAAQQDDAQESDT